MSSIRFLNDSAEFLYSLRLAEKILDELTTTWNMTWEKVLDETIRNVLKDLTGVSIYVFSLSEHDDRLSQWRAYGGGGTSYALGFDMPAMFPLIRKRGYLVAPCLYKRTDQELLIRAILEDVYETFARWIADTDGAPGHAQSHFAAMFYVQFMSVATMLKDPSFQEEGEWRLVSPPVWGSDAEASFRPGKTTLVPYRVFDLSEGGAGKLTDLVVGPSPHPEIALAAALHLKAASPLPIGAIRSTSTPFREI